MPLDQSRRSIYRFRRADHTPVPNSVVKTQYERPNQATARAALRSLTPTRAALRSTASWQAISVPASQSTQGQSTLQTTTWLRGIKGSGQAAGNLAGVGAEVTSDPCHNSGELIPMNWSQALDQLSPARVWYHPESASIGAINAMNSDPRRCPVTVKLQGKVRDPILLFGWGEKDLQVDLSGNTIREKSTLVAHHSITLQKNLLDFGDDPSRDNIPRQAAAVQLEGLFGPENPIRFHLINRGDIPKTLTFSLGIEGD